MFEYTFPTGSKCKINTPGFTPSMKDVKLENLSMSPDCIHTRTTYPNGFVFESEVYADKIIVKTNKKLADNGDGTLTVLEE